MNNFRDTTVQTLTLQPTVQDGVIMYEDSPLVSRLFLPFYQVNTVCFNCKNTRSTLSIQVKAVKNGHILVVDEADKAPTNVTCILKTLVESGEMHLSDGRRIVSGRWYPKTRIAMNNKTCTVV